MGFVTDKSALEQVLLRVLILFPVGSIPVMFHIHSTVTSFIMQCDDHNTEHHVNISAVTWPYFAAAI